MAEFCASDANPADLQLFGAHVEQANRCLGVVGLKGFQGAQISVVHVARALDLQRHKHVCAPALARSRGKPKSCYPTRNGLSSSTQNDEGPFLPGWVLWLRA